MSTPLYSISVDERDETHLTIYVSSFHPGQALPNPANPTFFFSLLCSENYEGSLLETAVGVHRFQHDWPEAWIAEHASAYISKVELLEVVDYPPQSGEYGVHPGGTYRLTTSHPDWIAHLKQGDLWETAVYQVDHRRRATSAGKPWEALFADLLERYIQGKRRKMQVGPEVLQQLIDALDCVDDTIASQALRWLSDVEGAGAALPRLLLALDDSGIRWDAFIAVRELNDPRAVPSLVCSLQYCSEGERWGCHDKNLEALRALAHLGPEAAFARKAVERCLASPSSKQRQMSFLTLYCITGEETSLEQFLRLYQEQPEHHFAGSLVEQFSTSVLSKLLPVLLGELDTELAYFIHVPCDPVCMALRRLGSQAVDALPILSGLMTQLQQEACRKDGYLEEEIAEARAFLEQTIEAISVNEEGRR